MWTNHNSKSGLNKAIFDLCLIECFFVCVVNSSSENIIDIDNTGASNDCDCNNSGLNGIKESTLIIISLIFCITTIIIALICAIARNCNCTTCTCCIEKEKQQKEKEFEMATISPVASSPSVNNYQIGADTHDHHNHVILVEKQGHLIANAIAHTNYPAERRHLQNDQLSDQNIQYVTHAYDKSTEIGYIIDK